MVLRIGIPRSCLKCEKNLILKESETYLCIENLKFNTDFGLNIISLLMENNTMK